MYLSFGGVKFICGYKGYKVRVGVWTHKDAWLGWTKWGVVCVRVVDIHVLIVCFVVLLREAQLEV